MGGWVVGGSLLLRNINQGSGKAMALVVASFAAALAASTEAAKLQQTANVLLTGYLP